MTQEDKKKFLEINRQIVEWIFDAPFKMYKRFKVEAYIWDGEMFIEFWSYSKKTTANIGAHHITITSIERWMPPEKIPAVMDAIEKHIKKGHRLPAEF